MNTITAVLGALGMACILAAATIGPDDIDSAQNVFDDMLTAQQTAECRHVRGRDAEVYTIGQHTVCRAATPVAGKL